MEALTLFLWGENLEKHTRVFGSSGWFKKCLGVLSLFCVSGKNLIQIGFGRGRLKG
ncbi:hypothetical protein HPCPY1962_0314 [Helicobacter pylori CPY1962]|nr:hypothetical protein HPCPY1962_0314 [Helicobacter pylori CPY1962]